MCKRIVILIGVLMLVLTAVAAAAPVTRVKDIAKVQGVRANQLQGYGLVVGLAGSGDSTKSLETIQSIGNMLKAYGVVVSTAQLQAKNVAAVIVTAQLPPFVKAGDNIDITVSSMGDAKSLQGGTLLQTPLKAANGKVYAVAQGSVMTGASLAATGRSHQKAFPTVGTLPNGAIVERDVAMQFVNNGQIALAINTPDFTTAARISEAINGRFGDIARPRDAGTVDVSVPDDQRSSVVSFVAAIEELPVMPDTIAKVVINERTGTIVMGGQVKIDEVAVSQGGLAIKIEKVVANGGAGGDAAGNGSSAQVKEERLHALHLPSQTSVAEIVSALNAVGATPKDIINILQAMKAAGALHADLQII